MPHIHKLIDFVVSAFIVHKQKVLLVHHKKLDGWLPVGGHIELNEDPEQALYREIEEESGLKPTNLTILSDRLNFKSDRTKYLPTPNYLDIHTISEDHEHVGLVYFLTSNTNKVSLAATEHNDIQWFTKQQLSKSQHHILPEIQLYAQKAIDSASSSTQGEQ